MCKNPRSLMEMLIPALPIEAAGIRGNTPEMSHNYDQMTVLQWSSG